jgi:hypothetical protein
VVENWFFIVGLEQGWQEKFHRFLGFWPVSGAAQFLLLIRPNAFSVKR